METLLVLTDFSDTAQHAAFYACMLAGHLKSKTIVLYHSYQAGVFLDDEAALANEIESLEQASLHNLQELERLIKEKIPPGITIRLRTDTLTLSDINTAVKEEGASLIIMGTVNKNKLEEIIMGSSALTVCKSSDYPVVLVPAHVEIQIPQNIIFACDLKEVQKTIPEIRLKLLLSDLKFPLTILNVEDESKYYVADTQPGSENLHDMLKEYNPEYYNIKSENVVEGIIEFSKQYTATLVLLISRRHHFMEGLFYRSLTRKLAYTSPFPLLVLRENE